MAEKVNIVWCMEPGETVLIGVTSYPPCTTPGIEWLRSRIHLLRSPTTWTGPGRWPNRWTARPCWSDTRTAAR